MQINAVHLHTLRMPLVAPFTTSFSTQTERTVILVELTADVDGQEVTGWGECVALNEPLYSSEYVAEVLDVSCRFLLPQLLTFQQQRPLTAEMVATCLAPIVGHRMAKAALEMAVLDTQLRAAGASFADYLGVSRDRIPSGVSVGIHDTIPELVTAVEDYLADGYRRIKLKIRPGWDIAPVRAIREAFGDIPLQVDANAAYTLVDAPQLRRLDEFGLLLIEQPLAEDDLRQHAQLARLMTTPMCLDESIVSAEAAADAIALGAAAVINIKPGRVGGYLEARRIHDIARASGVAVWCGGMLETGIGRAANAALAGLPGFTLTGDVSASNRFYEEDITPPIVMMDGYIEVPTVAGLCAEPIRSRIEKFTIETIAAC
ncbi:o-succinylbenzoate synthase [Leekyejoonella antrihumi]|uniref:o-succinylbenzoate synthase n=1 Tax=Leekyejoonella antrihumi TaxID=1660198 RepID=A0A563DXI5_9MICO|nr:o-succinylbenzoate synthase [Leekyejoonella antrihumi]TWP34970.1 o-succinylbenzoate synthase [Leekyejoonella antrihumi]